MPSRLLLSVVSSLALAAAFVGCNGEKEDGYQPVKDTPEVPEAEHATEGSHGGPVFDLGDHVAMVELVLDEVTRGLTVYVVDHDDVKKPYPVDAATARLILHSGEERTTIELEAMPQEGEAEGKASRFKATDELPASIEDVHDIDGELELRIDGKSITAVVEPGEHEHEAEKK
ncbi:MAG: hypothetical protein KY476_14080 [Planctomycetes bacterium]|nr:hypothetical protein [Planctomycetota bacterium]